MKQSEDFYKMGNYKVKIYSLLKNKSLAKGCRKE